MGHPVKTERNRAIGLAYYEGARLGEIAVRFGLSRTRVSKIVKAQGQSLSPLGFVRRAASANRKKASDPAFRQRLSASGKRAWAEGRGSGGRKKELIFADDAQRRLYRKLRDAIGAAAARREMGFPVPGVRNEWVEMAGLRGGGPESSAVNGCPLSNGGPA